MPDKRGFSRLNQLISFGLIHALEMNLLLPTQLLPVDFGVKYGLRFFLPEFQSGYGEHLEIDFQETLDHCLFQCPFFLGSIWLNAIFISCVSPLASRFYVSFLCIGNSSARNIYKFLPLLLRSPLGSRVLCPSVSEISSVLLPLQFSYS